MILKKIHKVGTVYACSASEVSRIKLLKILVNES